jgi:hypothetical protein
MSMLGRGEPCDRVPYFYSDQYDLRLEVSGWFEPGRFAEVVYRGDRDRREFIAFWLDAGGRVLAAMNVNVGDVTAALEKVIRSRASIDRDRLADPDVALEDLVPQND